MTLRTSTSLHCPNCGAPLHPAAGHTLTVCLYCNSSVRLQTEQGEPRPEISQSLSDAEMADLKALLLAGEFSNAVARFRQLTAASEADAEQAMNDLERQLTMRIIRGQLLTPLGIALVVFYTALFLIAAIAGWRGLLTPWLAIPLAVFAGLQLLYFGPGLRTTLAFIPGKIAPARIVKAIPLGVVTFRGAAIQTLKLLVEIQPDDAPAFLAELQSAARSERADKAQPGRKILVKYLPGDPAQVVFRQSLDD